MIVNINEKYFIDIDERNHTLKEKRISTDGKPTVKALAYCRSLHQALEVCNRRMLLDTQEEMKLSEYIELHKKGIDELIASCKGA